MHSQPTCHRPYEWRDYIKEIIYKFSFSATRIEGHKLAKRNLKPLKEISRNNFSALSGSGLTKIEENVGLVTSIMFALADVQKIINTHWEIFSIFSS